MSQAGAAPAQRSHSSERPPTGPSSTPAATAQSYSYSYDAGDSSRAPSLLATPAGTDPSLAVPSPNRSSSARRRHADASITANGNNTGESSRRTQKVRSTGGFLLQGALRDASSGPRRLASRTPNSQRFKSSPRPSERSGSSAGRDAEHRLSMDSPSRGAVLSPSSSPPQNLTVRKRQALAPAPVIQEPSQRPPSQGLQIDAAQIVNMALDLSESRRLASRRTVSNAMPPTLAPLPDGSTGGALKQHLQQQRRTSRNISPRPDLGRSPRLSSAATMASSPIHASFDASREGSFRYHFSPSTLTRAQKAKEQLELMAQYRRVLEMVPPLKPSARLRPGTASQSASPQNLSKASTANSTDGHMQFGRAYNPLQYIRNRKVRARERKGIDGAAQGFAEVKKVTDWVDNVALWAATGQTVSRDGPKLPPYPDADAQAQLGSPSAPGMKPKRPRVDWAIDPADMLADVYWLEQDNHIQLIEDRHWNRIFPKILEAPKPLVGHTERKSYESPRPQVQHSNQLTADPKADLPEGERKLLKSATHTSQSSSTRDRARQKIHDLKGYHRHNSSHGHHHDFLRRHKSSNSDLSGSDDEDKMRQGPRRTFTINSKDILEKQMLEMIAKEAREGSEQPSSSAAGSTSMATPERHRLGGSHDGSRKASLTDPSELDDKLIKAHAQRTGRASLEIPLPGRRTSFEMDPSLPNSPDAFPPRDSPFIPTIGAELSPPPTRSNSPSRNPFHKVKTRIFRDRSRERDAGQFDTEVHVDPKATPLGSIDVPPSSRRPSPDRGTSRSPARKPHDAEGADQQKSHGKKGSDAGVRGMFRGARIDNVIKGGVSRIGELIWRKEPDQDNTAAAKETDGEDTATDESDAEPSRGRHRPKQSVSRTPSTAPKDHDGRPTRGKTYLDIMPTFHHTSHDRSRPPSRNGGSTTGLQLSRPPSRSSRFDLLKPPRIDVQHASPSLSPPLSPPQVPFPALDPVRTDEVPLTTTQGESGPQEVRKRLNSTLSVAPSFRSERRLSASFGRRHWSLSDPSATPPQAPVSRRDVARLRALVLSSGIMALEIARRTNEPRPVFARVPGRPEGEYPGFWPAVAQLSPDPAALEATAVPQARLYQFAAQSLNESVEESIKRWQAAADEFANDTGPALRGRVEDVRRHIAVDLSAMARAAADEADETGRDLEHGQRLKTKQVVDMIEKLLRRRRRRFRWVRRGVWLGVEWVLVGFMWYVWFVVMIMRVFWTAGSGVWRGVRWLLWL